MRHQNNKMFLFSAFRDTQHRATNLECHVKVRAYLKAKGYAFKEILGCYKGKEEDSFAIIDTASEIESVVKALCLEHSQESYLVLDEDRNADLVFLNGQPIARLGRFHSTEKNIALGREAYTYCPDIGAYYVVD